MRELDFVRVNLWRTIDYYLYDWEGRCARAAPAEGLIVRSTPLNDASEAERLA